MCSIGVPPGAGLGNTGLDRIVTHKKTYTFKGIAILLRSGGKHFSIRNYNHTAAIAVKLISYYH